MLQNQTKRAERENLQTGSLEQSRDMISSDPNPCFGQPLEENKASFTREIDHYYCDFVLTKQETLKILLTSQLDASVFQRELSKEEKKAHEELNFFESLEEIYEFLQQNSTEESQKQPSPLIRIDQGGAIVIKAISILGKKERVRQISLKTHRVEQNKGPYLENVIKKMSKNLVEMKKEIWALKQKQSSFEERSAQLCQRLKSQGEKLQFIPDKSDLHSQQFSKKEKRIVKVNDNTTYYNLVSQIPINKTGISYFHIRVAETAQKNIIVGIGSKFIKGIQNAYTHPDFIGLYLFGEGYIWEKTNQRDLHLKTYPIQSGALITTIVDMDMGFVCWQVCRVRVAYALIPLELKAKLLFPIVMMINVNDAIILP